MRLDRDFCTPTLLYRYSILLPSWKLFTLLLDRIEISFTEKKSFLYKRLKNKSNILIYRIIPLANKTRSRYSILLPRPFPGREKTKPLSLSFENFSRETSPLPWAAALSISTARCSTESGREEESAGEPHDPRRRSIALRPTSERVCSHAGRARSSGFLPSRGAVC